MWFALLGLAVLALLLFTFRRYRITAVVAVVLTSVLLWKGVWDLCMFVDVELGIEEMQWLTGLLAVAGGGVLAFAFSTQISDVLHNVEQHF
jgi:hypothetical protein